MSAVLKTASTIFKSSSGRAKRTTRTRVVATRRYKSGAAARFPDSEEEMEALSRVPVINSGSTALHAILEEADTVSSEQGGDSARLERENSIESTVSRFLNSL